MADLNSSLSQKAKFFSHFWHYPALNDFAININGLILLEPKSDTKKLLGRSPDRADAFVMGIWGLQYVTPDENRRRKSNIDAYRTKHKVTWMSA